MKIFKAIVIIGLALIMLGSVGLFILIKTFDAGRFKDQLASQLSAQLNRKVEMEKLNLSFSLFQGFFFTAEKFQVADDAKFSNGPFLSVGEIRLAVNLLTFLIERKVVVPHIIVISPEINLVRNADGIVNIQALGPKEKITSPVEEKSTPSAAAPAPSGKKAPADKKEISNLPQLLIRTIRLENGKLTYVDKVEEPPVTITIDRIALHVVDLSSTSPFKFTLGSSVLSQKQNLEIKGQGQLDLKTQQVRLDDVKINFDLSAITMSELEKAAPSLKPSELGLTIKGKMDTVVSQMVAGPEGLLLLAATGKISNAKMDAPKVPLSVQGGMDFEVSEKDVNVPNMAFKIGEGSLGGQLRIDEYLKQQRYFCNLEFKNVLLAKSLPEFGPQVNFHGQLNGLLKLNGQGFKPDKFLAGLSGESQLDIQQGVIENFNILKFILSKISMFPQLVDVLDNNLPEEYKTEVNQNRTVFDKIDVKTTVKEGNVLVERGEFMSPAFSLNTQGRIDRDQSLNLTAVLKVAKDLAAQMTAAAGELKALEEEDGQLGIPVKVNGSVSHLQILPDPEALAKKMIMGKGKGNLEGLLNKVLGNKETPDQLPNEQNPSGGESPGKTINNVLDSIFK